MLFDVAHRDSVALDHHHLIRRFFFPPAAARRESDSEFRLVIQTQVQIQLCGSLEIGALRCNIQVLPRLF